MPFRRPGASTPSSTADFSAIVAEVEKLIDLLRELEDAERFPRKERPIHVNDLRPLVRRALAEHPLTKDRCQHWQELVRQDDYDEVIEFLKRQLEFHEDLSFPCRGDSSILFTIFPVVAASVFAAVVGFRAGELGEILVATPVALVGLGFLVVWSISRLRSVRRVQLWEEEAWLPATGIWLRGHRVHYEDIESVQLYSHADRKLKVVFPGGIARFGHNSLDVRKLAEELEHRSEAVRRRKWVLRQFGVQPPG